MAQLVARYLGVVEAVGSSPVTQTIGDQHYPRKSDAIASDFFVILTKIYKQLHDIYIYILHKTLTFSRHSIDKGAHILYNQSNTEISER